MSAAEALQDAEQRARSGDVAGADAAHRRAINAEPNNPRCHAAYGHFLARVGAVALAADAFRNALKLDPNLPGARAGLARAALNAGNATEAEQVARRLTVEAPNAEAWDLLAGALRAQDRLEESERASEAALKLDANAAYARHNRAITLNRLGRSEEALKEYDSLIARGVQAPALWLNRGAALMGLVRAEEAEAAFADGIRRWPFDSGLQNALASTRWMRGAGADFTRDFEAAVRQQPSALPLRVGCADLLRRAGFGDKAEAFLREGLAQQPDEPALLGSLGVMLDELDRTAEGLPFLQRAVARAPSVTGNRANLAAALMRLGRADEALAEIEPARQTEPLNQEWLCYETMALRQLGHPRYHELCDYDLMVQPYDITPPRGFATVAAFNEALTASLNKLHVLDAYPLDQSLRNGSQTTRGLLSVDDPIIQAYIKALDEPIRAYMGLMRDPDHPWSGRKTGNYKISGAWSVKLKANGFHINHLHPAGWISSAYYVSLPPAVQGADQQGWIKFGEPRWPTPGCTVEKVVQPKEGRLVLFPSYMWHGTIPFAAGERLTAPFDAVPA
jgi:predicted Zn-dependent protease